MKRAPLPVLDAQDLAYLVQPLQGTNLTAAEAVRLASHWWDATGRGLINRKANESREPDAVKAAGAETPAIRIRGSASRSVNSGILDARPWADLDRRERSVIVKTWLEHQAARH